MNAKRFAFASIKAVYRHPGFSRGNFSTDTNDIAISILNINVVDACRNNTEVCGAIPAVMTVDSSKNRLAHGQYVRLLGFGKRCKGAEDNELRLRQVDAPIMGMTRCRKMYSSGKLLLKGSNFALAILLAVATRAVKTAGAQ